MVSSEDEGEFMQCIHRKVLNINFLYKENVIKPSQVKFEAQIWIGIDVCARLMTTMRTLHKLESNEQYYPCLLYTSRCV